MRKLVMNLITAGESSGNIYSELLTGVGASGNKGSTNVSVERSSGNDDSL